MTSDEAQHIGLVLENIRQQNRVVIEAVVDIRDKVATLPTREEFNEPKSNVRVIKAAVADLSPEHRALEKHVTRLENAHQN